MILNGASDVNCIVSPTRYRHNPICADDKRIVFPNFNILQADGLWFGFPYSLTGINSIKIP